MKRTLLLSVLGILVLFAGWAYSQYTAEAPRISKDELKAKLGSPGLVLLDVRIHKDWEKSDEKIVGAVRMDPEAVDAWAGTLPKDKEIVLYCA